MKDKDNYVITVEVPGDRTRFGGISEVRLKLPKDSSIDEFLDNFISMLHTLGFHTDTEYVCAFLQSYVDMKMPSGLKEPNKNQHYYGTYKI
jgi:hypothetical protein